MYTMIPATEEKINPNVVSVKKLRRTKYPISAPTGSARPERNE